MKRAYVAVAATVGLFVVVQLGSLALVEPFKDAGLQTVEDPSDPTNTLLYIGAILLATLVMLAAMRFGIDRFLQGLLVFAAVFLSFYVFTVVVPNLVTVGGVNVLAAAGAVGLGVGLLYYPEWWVIDAAGILMGAGAAGLFGISFGLLPALLLLAALAVYDAISVYGTEHMLTLASGAMDLRLPVVFVIPLSLSYSFLDDDGPQALEDEDEHSDPDEGDDNLDDETDNSPGDAGVGTNAANGTTPDEPSGSDGDEETAPEPFGRDAFFIGLGDAVIPTILVASAAFFRPGDAPLLDVPGVAVTVPALGAMVGTLAGLLVLLWMVMKGRAHAGLPLLNGGAIAGYLAGTLVAGVAILEALGVAVYI